jgi:hypothetical protein
LKKKKERGYIRKRGNGEKLGIASKYLGLKPQYKFLLVNPLVINHIIYEATNENLETIGDSNDDFLSPLKSF